MNSLLELSVLDGAQLKLKDIVSHSCLDSPRAKQLLTGRLVFSGWVLKKDQVDGVSILIRNGSNNIPITLDVMRPDVLEKVLKVRASAVQDHDLIVCGFSKEIQVDVQHGLAVYFVSGGAEYLWKEITYTDCCFDVKEFKGFWSVFVGDDASEAGVKNASNYLLRLGAGVVNEVVFKNVITTGVDDFLSSSDPDSYISSKRFFEYVTAPDFCIRAVETALSNGSILVPDPFGYGLSSCQKSYSVPGNINILKFISPVGEVLYIFQHVSSADAIFFPARERVVLIKHLPLQSVKNSIGRLLEDPKRAFENSSSRNDFLGIIASHGRPYHFYYDVAPAVNDLNDAGLLERVSNIFYYEGGDFCSFASLYRLDVGEAVASTDSLWDRQKKSSGYCFHVGALFNESRVANAVNFDGKLLSYSRGEFDCDNDKSVRTISECYPVVWFGVTVQKRSWIEQVDAAVSILNKLHEFYPRLGVVFDGWTSPLSTTEVDLRETRNDLQVCDKIIEKLPSTIKKVSVIGAVSYRKIVISRLVDVYVGNAATGGLHVARFCSRPGVAHLNTKLIDSNEHIRNRTILVDKKFIKDCPEDADLRSDFISYSLDWRVVYDSVLSILRGGVGL